MLTRSQSESIVSLKYGEFLIDGDLLEEICAEFDDCKESVECLITHVKSFLAHAIDMGVSKIQHGFMMILLPDCETGRGFGYSEVNGF